MSEDINHPSSYPKTYKLKQGGNPVYITTIKTTTTSTTTNKATGISSQDNTHNILLIQADSTNSNDKEKKKKNSSSPKKEEELDEEEIQTKEGPHNPQNLSIETYIGIVHLPTNLLLHLTCDIQKHKRSVVLKRGEKDDFMVVQRRLECFSYVDGDTNKRRNNNDVLLRICRIEKPKQTDIDNSFNLDILKSFMPPISTIALIALLIYVYAITPEMHNIPSLLLSVYFMFTITATSTTSLMNNMSLRREERRLLTIVFEIELLSFVYTPHSLLLDQSSNEQALLQTIPPRYYLACPNKNGTGPDKVEALKRWSATLSWRASNGIDAILQTHNTQYFNSIKKHYPHFYAGKGKSGNMVYFEYLGNVDIGALKKDAGEKFDLDDMVRHYLYISEFAFLNLSPLDTDKCITVLDVRNVKLNDLKGDVKSYLVKTMSIMQEFYPERSEVILIVNASVLFTMVWRIVKPMINPRTLAKIRIVGSGREEVKKCLEEFIDISQIPRRFGGDLNYNDDPGLWTGEEKEMFAGRKYDGDDCRWFSDEERELRSFVCSASNNQGVISEMEIRA